MMMLASMIVRSIVHEHGKALDGPERLQLGIGLLFAEHAILERRVVLVQRDQHLLAVRGEGMGVELQGHRPPRGYAIRS